MINEIAAEERQSAQKAWTTNACMTKSSKLTRAMPTYIRPANNTKGLRRNKLLNIC